ncbi:PepSY domain-containing protein [Actinophytocola sp.]|uniref:PepSY domain-containing protein n=1 Tax=Actinophytocola sp. TaxID=1872138 RepID=UPI002EDA90F3
MNRRTLVVAAAAGAIVVSGGAAIALAATGGPLSAGAQPTSTFDPTSISATSEDRPTSTPSAAPGQLSADDAGRIAQERLGGGTVINIERELEHGRTEWKVELTKDGVTYDVRVDASTGDITRIDQGSGRGGRTATPTATHLPTTAPTATRDDNPHPDDNGGLRGGHGSDDPPGDDHGGHGSDDPPGDDKGGDR